jgi:pimeloyl-ACP methyl ester carboxylesterase
VLELLTRLLTLEWRRSGAAIREVEVLGARVWYAEFAPSGGRPPRLPLARLRAGRPRPPAPAHERRRAPTVILLHGLGASAASFYPVIGHLRRAYRVIVPDLPGYGWSRPPKGRGFLTFGELVDVAEAFVAKVTPRGAFLA